MKKPIAALVALLALSAAGSATPQRSTEEAQIAARAGCVDGKIVIQVATSGPGVWSIILDANPCAGRRLGVRAGHGT